VAVSTSPSGGARISLRVYPNAPRNQVVGLSDGVLAVRVAAPPVKGQANRELVSFLSQLLGVNKGRLSIIRGHTSRNKLISVSDLSYEEAIRRLLPV
jgi:uncharacterized protein (TIGR00251 family)